jgi:hypothetical protein
MLRLPLARFTILYLACSQSRVVVNLVFVVLCSSDHQGLYAYSSALPHRFSRPASGKHFGHRPATFGSHPASDWQPSMQTCLSVLSLSVSSKWLLVVCCCCCCCFCFWLTHQVLDSVTMLNGITALCVLVVFTDEHGFIKCRLLDVLPCGRSMTGPATAEKVKDCCEMTLSLCSRQSTLKHTAGLPLAAVCRATSSTTRPQFLTCLPLDRAHPSHASKTQVAIVSSRLSMASRS